jgi:hypothetical protein
LALADGQEDVGNLENVVEVLLSSASPLENFVLVTGDLISFLP